MSILDISMMTGFVPDTSDLELVPRPGELRLGGRSQNLKEADGREGSRRDFYTPTRFPS
jgi:hypothetical protein